MKMKKFFLSTLYFVTLSLLFAACSGSNEPENKSFDIQITEIGSNTVTAIITPSNDNMEWTYSIFLTAEARELGFKGYIIEDFRKEGITYAYLSESHVIYHGKREIIVPFPSAGAEYTLCIFYVDKELNIISDVFSRSFYTSSTGYIDLGLPSGKLWGKEPPCASVNYASIPSAFVKYLPTKAEWQELIDNCDFKWDAISKSFCVKGRNGISIWLDRTVAGENKAYYWSCTGYDITNTYRWVLVLEEDKAPEFTTMPNFAAVGVMQVIPNPNSVQ